MKLKAAYETWAVRMRSPRGKRVLRAVRGAFIVGVIALLVYQLSKIGWMEVLRALPTQPVFYILLLAMYFLLPTTESLVYSRLWRLRVRDCLPVMLRKRVLNVDVVGYSGEIYLLTWAKRRLSEPPRRIMAVIKDNLILTSVTSVAAAAVLLAGLLLSGRLDASQMGFDADPIYIGLGAVTAALASTLVFRFRRLIFSLPRRTVAWIGGVHMTRFLVGYALQVAHWWVVIPSASFETWAVLLTASVLINRIPLLPSSDLVFVSAGAGLTTMLDVPVAPVVGMLLVRSTADRLLNLVFFTTTVWRERQQVYSQEDSQEDIRPFENEDEHETASRTPAPLNT